MRKPKPKAAASPALPATVYEWLNVRLDGPPNEPGMYMVQVDLPGGRTRYLARVVVTPALPAAAALALARRMAERPDLIGVTPGVEDYRSVPVQGPLPVLKCDGGFTKYPPGLAPHDFPLAGKGVNHVV